MSLICVVMYMYIMMPWWFPSSSFQVLFKFTSLYLLLYVYLFVYFLVCLFVFLNNSEVRS